jgi:hypothetical protein
MDMTEILSELTDHGFEDTSDARKVALVNDTYFDLCSREAWPFLEKQATLNFTGSDTPSNLPADFSKLISLVNPTTGQVIQAIRSDDFANRFTLYAADVADPIRYYFIGSNLRVNPVPPSGTTLKINYIANPVELNDTSVETDILVPARHQRTLVLGALAKLYLMEDDPELSAAFNAMFEGRIQTMRADLWSRDFAPDFIHNTDPDVDPLLGF